MIKNYVLLSIPVFLFLLPYIYAEETEKTHDEIFTEVQNVDVSSSILAIYGIIFSLLALIISIAIATLIYDKSNKDAKQHTADLKKFTRLTSLHQTGNLYYNTKDYTNAKKNYEAALKIEPNNIQLLHNLGATLAQLNKWSDAIRISEQIVAIDPYNVGAWNNLGLAYEAIGEYVESAISYYKGLRVDIKSGEIINNIGKLYEEKFNEHDWALHFYDRVINEKIFDGSELADTIFNKGLVFRNKLDENEALKMFDKALVHDKNNVKILTEKAITLHRLGRSRDSLICSNLVLKIDPKQENILLNKAIVLADTSLQDAIDVLDEYQMRNPYDHLVPYNKGSFYKMHGNNTLAISEWRKAIELNPNFILAYDNLATEYMSQRDYPTSLTIFETAKSLDSTNTHLLNNMGACLCYLNQYERAIFECFYEVFKITPKDPQMLRNMSEAFARLENYPMANLCWEAYLLAQQFPN